jgi:hypothetical protein
MKRSPVVVIEICLYAILIIVATLYFLSDGRRIYLPRNYYEPQEVQSGREEAPAGGGHGTVVEVPKGEAFPRSR